MQFHCIPLDCTFTKKEMMVNTRMPQKLKIHFNAEYTAYSTALISGNYQQAWHLLERAHILGQRYPIEHSLIHWKMLQFGIKTKNIPEILGQLPRLFFGGIKSFVGKVPLGNTGGANVAALKTLAIPNDLNKILKERLI